MSILVRGWCAVLGIAMLLHAIWGRGNYRWSPYEIEDESDVPIGRRTGRIWEAVIGVVLILGAMLVKTLPWTPEW